MKPKRKKWSEFRWYHFENDEIACNGHVSLNEASQIVSDGEPDIRKIKMTEV